jgi:murein DD-endopeptidase MepM/ murein hydrolase activator NlpD
VRRLVPLLLAAALLVVPFPAAGQSSPPVPAWDAVLDLTYPVERVVTYSDDYFACRGGAGCPRLHRATDLGGPGTYGLRIHAAVGGRVTRMTGLDGPPPAWGYAVYVLGDDGRTYVYLHLGAQDGPASGAYAPGLRPGDQVERGQHLGFLGHSGNASPSWPHLHLEIHDPAVRTPDGSDRRNPYASLKAAEARGDIGAAGLRAFVDVPREHPHHDAVATLNDRGVTGGCAVRLFCPDRAVTRGQMATFLARALDLPAPGGPLPFPDAVGTHADGIAKVAAAGIATGLADGRFAPDAPVRRDQMATFLARALDLDTSGQPSFPDVTRGNVHAGAIAAVAARGIAQGHTDGTYGPADRVTRAHMAAFLTRAFPG